MNRNPPRRELSQASGEVSATFREVCGTGRKVSRAFREVSGTGREVSAAFREVCGAGREVNPRGQRRRSSNLPPLSGYKSRGMR